MKQIEGKWAPVQDSRDLRQWHPLLAVNFACNPFLAFQQRINKDSLKSHLFLFFDYQEETPLNIGNKPADLFEQTTTCCITTWVAKNINNVLLINTYLFAKINHQLELSFSCSRAWCRVGNKWLFGHQIHILLQTGWLSWKKCTFKFSFWPQGVHSKNICSLILFPKTYKQFREKGWLFCSVWNMIW